MTDNSLKKYYDILELENDASGEDINKAYKHLKNLYSKTSLATAPIDNEWNEDDKQEILNQVEEAYIKLWPYAREENTENTENTESTESTESTQNAKSVENIENVEDIESAERTESAESAESANEITNTPTITPLEEPLGKDEPVIERQEYRPREEPAVSIELDEAEPPKEMPEKKAELFASYVEEEVLFDLGTASEIETEMEIEIDPKVDEVELKKEQTKEETRESELEKVPEEVPEKKSEEIEKKVKKEIEKEDTLAEQFVGGIEAQLITGEVLKKIREKLELGFPELANSTQVPVEALKAIEEEAFDKLPEAGYLRYYVTSFARALAHPDPKGAADQYMKRFREWKFGPTGSL